MEKITLDQRFARASVVGVAGAAVAGTLMATTPPLWGDWTIVRCGLGGAFLAGLVVARGFGGSGCWAWFRAGFFFSLATVLGFFLGIFLIPLDATIVELGGWQALEQLMILTTVGPFLIQETMGEDAVIMTIWGAGLVGCYLATLKPRSTSL